jgi:hypothetical protein
VSLSKRELALLVILIAVSGFYLLYYHVLHPLNLQITQLNAENISLINELPGMETELARLANIRMENQQIWYDYEKLLDKVPQSPMIPQIIGFMDLSAREAGVKLLSINYKESPVAKRNDHGIAEGTSGSLHDKAERDGKLVMDNVILKNEEKAGSMVQALNFKLVARGTHLNLLSFLLKIENAPRIYKVNSFKMIMVRNSQQKTGLGVEDPSQEENSGTKKDFVDVAVKESQAYDANYTEVNLDFTAFFNRLEFSGISAETTKG